MLITDKSNQNSWAKQMSRPIAKTELDYLNGRHV